MPVAAATTLAPSRESAGKSDSKGMPCQFQHWGRT